MVGGEKRPGENVLCSGGKTDMRHTHPTPPSCNRKKDPGLVCDKRSLQLRSQHEVAIVLLLRGERGKDVTTDAEVG